MASIAEPIAKPASRFRFILDRRDVLGAIFVAPAILYVLLLVGVPLLLSIYYSVSAYTIYNPSWRFVGLANFAQIVENPDFLRTLGNTFIFTFGSRLRTASSVRQRWCGVTSPLARVPSARARRRWSTDSRADRCMRWIGCPVSAAARW